MAWVMLLLAGLFEIMWAIGLKYSESFTKLWPSVFTIIAMIISVILLGVSVRTIPLGTAYAIWTGIGAIGAVIAGIILFNEPVLLLRMIFVGLILIGVLGLKIVSSH
ncbi:DMT family transporter [Rickettsiales endosymbiont of Stachyamoeba lipophora]|uniref:DMT family transporter n=1 Tax=Rickettsiales endosymbiont of Stachyamoeba lipophora TaxID=2486578 RepID=UPI000F64F12E|nr:multidrug efflux SMR transporter [Rickettsiales endosymbiont of Stachyamoeba lipophora]AZL16121.1 QacE family quaternary ammonium compound efflux SMR transporter [Rickettsiales endosymbiont of Stachyamoeba lipophora]